MQGEKHISIPVNISTVIKGDCQLLLNEIRDKLESNIEFQNFIEIEKIKEHLML